MSENHEMCSESSEHVSPSGKYRLTVSSVATKPGCWNHTRGEVARVASGEPIACIDRNYSWFPFSWIEGHPNGHDYFVCGENYQGQTVIELDTGKRRDHLPAEASDGVAFCWAEHRFEPVAGILVVGSCIWAAPYEYRFYDFADPMNGWSEIEADEWIDMGPKWPTVDADGLIRCYQTSGQGDDDDDGATKPAVADVAIKTFKRDGLKLVLVNEWVSDEEQERRARAKEARLEYERQLAEFRANDPLYLAYLELVKDPDLSPESYEGIGVTYSGWCPHFSGNERRMCRRLIKREGYIGHTVDLEWAAESGPVKLVVYRDGKHVEDRWFEHSVDGMRAAFVAAKAMAQ